MLRIITLYLIINILLISGCSKDKPTLRKPRAESTARDVLEYGRALFNQEEYKKAIQEYRYVIAHYPKNKKECAWAQYELAYSYYCMKEYDKALQEFKKVEMLYPEQSGPVILAKKMITKLQIKMNR